ncbi:DUF1501 domain-containing protein [Rhodopirellula sp. MGV]|uniref:DUF1501 domain-containing protein n=1 Tax=Rhodopirellula sp. MGV TaxID=2023130 RepID=UPI000B968851|nr:DUF1501 domain-containing protein [Rhodopirellula sp. MGV]OYP36380.1 sulfatase [Rhodopirellula sp. MGV]PNY38387.1 DUF1501 domain-containing protein [Rhodopirellula baltica]
MLTRRELLKHSSAGFGYMAMAGMAHAAESTATSPLAPKQPHFAAKAKRVIFLCMQGGPSHVDTFDYKPDLQRDHGKRGKYGGALLKSPWEFRQRGESGLWISDLFPQVAEHADEMCLIRSMHCDQPVHPGAMTQMHTGTAQFVRPSIGAWTLYGLGTENESLPGFVSLSPPVGNSRNYGSAFLPAIYGGTKVGRPGSRFAQLARRSGSTQDSVPDIRNPNLSDREQRRQLNLIQKLNQSQMPAGDTSNVDGVIQSYELAFRMQDAMPSLMDLAGENAKTLKAYGADGGPTETFGKQCLLARRFAEAGVRFIEITHGNWDQHTRLTADHAARAEACDKPIAALLADLKARNMLDETLVIWGGEFGRTPSAQSGDGRNHNNKGYTLWMAGGGVKGGFSYGATDEHGFEAVENPCHVHDWHATVLHLMGLDHEQLTYRYAGRDFRLTDVYGNVVHDIIA